MGCCADCTTSSAAGQAGPHAARCSTSPSISAAGASSDGGSDGCSPRRTSWPGFRRAARGFLTLSDTADFQYKCSDVYHPGSERTIRWDDPDIAIDWPDAGVDDYVLSERDLGTAESLRDAEVFE